MIGTIHNQLQRSVYQRVRVVRSDQDRSTVEGILVSTRSDTYRVESQEFHLLDVKAVCISGAREPQHAVIILN
jgi:hypothetical protein